MSNPFMFSVLAVVYLVLMATQLHTTIATATPRPKDGDVAYRRFFENGKMDWLTSQREDLLVGGRWNPVTQIYTTADGLKVGVDLNLEIWYVYFGKASPKLLDELFPNGETWDEKFGWMTKDFFDIWGPGKPFPTPAPTPAPTQPPTLPPTYPPEVYPKEVYPPENKNVIPNNQVVYFINGQLNWLNPIRYTLLVGGRWDPATLTWYTADGRQIKPNTETWDIYFGNATPSTLNALFPNGKTWNETFGWMTIDYFQIWTTWQNVPTKAPTPAPQPPNVIPTYQTMYFNNGQMNWLNPTRYNLLLGGRWDPFTSTWYTADGRRIWPSSPEWTTYFGNLQPSNLNVLFPNGGSFNQAFGWITPSFFQQWTGWNQVAINRVQIFIPGNIPPATRQLFASGQVNWLTPERVRMLAGGHWTGSEYITKTNVRVTPGSPNWSTYFGTTDPSGVNALFRGPGYWDQSFSWVTEAIKNVPLGRYSGSFQWNNVVNKK